MGSSLDSDFTSGSLPDGWSVTAGTITYDSTTGAAFTISEEGDAPTIQTTDYFFFGSAEVKMQAAPGTGIVSTIVMESDDLDEVDWVCSTSFPRVLNWIKSNTHVGNSGQLHHLHRDRLLRQGLYWHLRPFNQCGR
jgi:Glycosyl hydrolases family 16